MHNKSIIESIREDRQLGVIEHVDEAENQARLVQLGAANWLQPPLEPAPCVRLKETGEIFVWTPFFAARPDLCESCDEHGNTDPAAWRGRMADQTPVESPVEAAKDTQPEKPAESAPLAPPSGLHFNFDEFRVEDFSIPPMEMAAALLGTDPEHNSVYHSHTGSTQALPLDNITSANVPVTAAVQQYFTNQPYV